jgi:hypothetical protein
VADHDGLAGEQDGRPLGIHAVAQAAHPMAGGVEGVGDVAPAQPSHAFARRNERPAQPRIAPPQRLARRGDLLGRQPGQARQQELAGGQRQHHRQADRRHVMDQAPKRRAGQQPAGPAPYDEDQHQAQGRDQPAQGRQDQDLAFARGVEVRQDMAVQPADVGRQGPEQQRRAQHGHEQLRRQAAPPGGRRDRGSCRLSQVLLLPRG